MSRFTLFKPRPADWEPNTDATAILADAIAEHDPSHVFALFSGGTDSVLALDVARRHPRFTAAVFVDTGTAVDAVVEYVHEAARWFGVPLLTYSAGPDAYECMIAEYGFPGKAQHGASYVRLKERALDKLVSDHKTHFYDRIAFVTGVREAESVRRMGTAETVVRSGATVWIAPLISWEQSDKAARLAELNPPRNPCWDTLGRSGECNCGAYAAPGERERMVREHPDMAAKLDRWTAIAKANGTPCQWGENPPKPWPGEDAAQIGFLCAGCQGDSVDRELRLRIAETLCHHCGSDVSCCGETLCRGAA